MSKRESKEGVAKAPLANFSEFDNLGLDVDNDETAVKKKIAQPVAEEGNNPPLMLTNKGRMCDTPSTSTSDNPTSTSQQDVTAIKKPVEKKAETERVRKKKPHVHKHNGAAEMVS